MEPDDELCLCFHISWRKVLNYVRVHRVRLPSQLAECGGAGTGCGWCRKQLERITAIAADSPPSAEEIDTWLASNTPGRRAYAEGRAQYRAQRKIEAKGETGDANVADLSQPSASETRPGLDNISKDAPSDSL
jgi:bacterioferritin-associated ferredoxin